MELAVVIAGALAVAAAWRAVVAGRSVWRVMPPTLLLLGLAAVVVRRPVAGTAGPGTAIPVGVVAGVALYAATRAFVAAVRRWRPFRRHAEEAYEVAGEVPLIVALLLAVGVTATGEELFWRGLVQARLAEEAGRWGGAVLTWVGYVAANLASGSLPIVAAAVVAGGAWAALAAWSGGIVASLACHAVWTALMIALPPQEARVSML